MYQVAPLTKTIVPPKQSDLVEKTSSDKTRASMKTQENYLGLARRYFRGKSWEVNRNKAPENTDGSYLRVVDNDSIEGATHPNVLQLPDDVWLGILSHLQILDVVR